MSTFEAPRESLYRMIQTGPAHIEVRADGDNNMLIGYAARFNEPTEINSWEGRFVEQIAPGAFNKTLKERGDRVKVLFDHGYDSRFGGAPIAVPKVIREDGDGLYVEAVFVDTEAGREMRELIRSGAIDGMSFKFSVVKDDWEESTPMPVRTLREVRLYELGPVTFPAYEATTIGVRSREAFELWKSRSELSGESDAADSGTSKEPSDTPPAVAPVGVHRKRAAHARRKLGRRFPEIEGVEG